MLETPLLREPQIPPSKEVLADVLGKSYAVFNELMEIITNTKYGLEPKWNYYKDGKAWLCKVEYKKKTVFWLSVWDKFFKTAFYFTEKNCLDIAALDIDEKIKVDFNSRKPIGKLLPLAINIGLKEQIKDAIKVIEYKKSKL